MKQMKYYLKSKLSQKYHNYDLCYDMIKEQESDWILNPAYNEEFEKVLKHRMRKFSREHTIEYREDIEALEISSSIVGCGGIGANILYFLQDFKYKSKTSKPMNIQAFEYDTWEFTNLPRIPFKNNLSSSKMRTMTENGCATSDEDGYEDNINDPLFYEGFFNGYCNDIPVGAMDLETRNNLFHLRAPFITITHKDDELRIVLCPSENTLDIASETYGMINVNFLLPATYMAAEWLHDFLIGNVDQKTDAGKIYKEIDDFKILKKKIFDPILDFNDKAYKNCLEAIKEESPIENGEEDYFKRQRLYTYKELYHLLNFEKGCEYLSKVVGKKFKKEKVYPEEIWNKMVDRELLVIKEEDVSKWLKMIQNEFDKKI